MKALSIQQPWAWLIANGHKPVENRTWATKFRGEVYIHASKKFDRAGYQWVRATFPEIQMPSADSFERGGIVGKATIDQCVSQHPSPWFFGPYGFVMRHQKVLPFLPCNGALGFFDVTAALKGKAA